MYIGYVCGGGTFVRNNKLNYTNIIDVSPINISTVKKIYKCKHQGKGRFAPGSKVGSLKICDSPKIHKHV